MKKVFAVILILIIILFINNKGKEKFNWDPLHSQRKTKRLFRRTIPKFSRKVITKIVGAGAIVGSAALAARTTVLSFITENVVWRDIQSEVEVATEELGEAIGSIIEYPTWMSPAEAVIRNNLIKSLNIAEAEVESIISSASSSAGTIIRNGGNAAEAIEEFFAVGAETAGVELAAFSESAGIILGSAEAGEVLAGTLTLVIL